MGIEDKLDATISAVEGLQNRIDLAIRAPREIERLHKKILTAKAKLNGVEDEYAAARKAAFERVEKEAEARRRDLERDAERDHVAACATRVKAIAELSFVMASFRAIEKKTNPYDVIERHFSEEVQKEIKKMLEDASFKAERLIVEMAWKSVQQPVTDGTPDK